jgi:hypothetical protein
VKQDGPPCVATIFEVGEIHKPVEFEDKGIDFVATALIEAHEL